MFSDDTNRTVSEERFLLDQVLNSMVTKELGVWFPLARIGGLYAQQEKPRLTNFETIRNPEPATGVPGERSADFFTSKYYRKRVKELRGYIEKIRPFNAESDGLIVIGKRLDLGEFSELPEVVKEETQTTVDQPTAKAETHSLVKASMSPNRLFFLSTPGATKSQTVRVVNKGTTAIYYKWEIVHEVELMSGEGADRAVVKAEGPGGEVIDDFDWSASDAFNMPRNQRPKTRSEFSFTQARGSIRPGCSVDFDFVFKSDIPGCFTQKWIMRITPSSKDDKSLTVSLRGCCEVEPPNLNNFKKSINESLHESERTRCIDEILAAVFERVAKVCDLHHRPGEERIDADVLVDDRAPAFEEANRKWGLVYSPGLYSALLVIANDCWDALGLTGFDRFWDLRIESLTEMAMKIENPALKREILARVNETMQNAATASAPGNLAFSLAFVQWSTYLEDLTTLFMRDAAALGVTLPFFVVPKVPDPAELEDALESQRKKHRRAKDKKPPPPPPPKKSTKKGKGGSDDSARTTPVPEANWDTALDLKARVRETIREELRKKLLVFEHLAGESQGVTQQLTRVNDLDKLDTNLEREVDDEL
jgi:hypothetical protein